MPSYVFLLTWTDQGIRDVKQSPERGDSFRQAVEAEGGRIVALLHTMGIYDIVLMVELPSDEVANRLALRTGRQGYVRSTTLKGWTTTEFEALVRTL